MSKSTPWKLRRHTSDDAGMSTTISGQVARPWLWAPDFAPPAERNRSGQRGAVMLNREHAISRVIHGKWCAILVPANPFRREGARRINTGKRPKLVGPDQFAMITGFLLVDKAWKQLDREGLQAKNTDDLSTICRGRDALSVESQLRRWNCRASVRRRTSNIAKSVAKPSPLLGIRTGNSCPDMFHWTRSLPSAKG